MCDLKKIKSALISVYYKDNLVNIVRELDKAGVQIISTGGTRSFIEGLGINVVAVEDLTSYPSILGGRVKTLHPKVFGGILARRDNSDDLNQLKQYEIPEIDLVVVDLYPFEETVAGGAAEQDIIEKIDIGGISLIRAAAKNFKDTLIVSSRNQYGDLLNLLKENECKTSLSDRRRYAGEAFAMSSHYDAAIFNYFNGDDSSDSLRVSYNGKKSLRYGENPHQKGKFYGNLDDILEQLHGKEISYNNLLDIDAAISLINDFSEPTFAVLKHNNACGVATRSNLTDAWKDALAGDPVSAFGGVLVCNRPVDKDTAEEINKLFFEVIIAPEYLEGSLDFLKTKKNRIILVNKTETNSTTQFRSLLNGVLVQDKDTVIEKPGDLKVVTDIKPEQNKIEDLLFANKLVKHSKSNAIVLAKGNQLIASGVGQTSRVDALKQAIDKAKSFNFDLNGAVMASDAFFPFADCVEIAHAEGIDTVIQPGGSVRDSDSIEFCNKNGMAMVTTGNRHFKH
ncbi:MAG: bifunctional phosphoribosylaminoimidazolecarboxamide formyltransferase/IMP cyclohydrolase [Bacteroidales bacterium]|jgi:phosphoribosylaminoimidazolecarboxamide formyltransferase/IMP cyclohydrolase|nr:bifunctional phosphoribosylaminoimidazolecarboxamide formyltransferase/IMP cyclohydrolase [Bacteroidales bacterium]